MTFSVVIPVYRNEASIGELVSCLEKLNRDMDGDLEVVFVVDGSPDRSQEILGERLPEAGFRSQLLSLSRNFGSFAAILAGLAHGKGSHFAVMAADLQEPPELLLEFRERLLKGDVDIVAGRRTARADPPLTRLASATFWRLYRLLVQKAIPKGGVDVFACTRVVRDHLLLLRESNSTLVGLLFWVGFRRTDVAYVRKPRRQGTSSWSVSRRIRYLLDTVFAFSDLPVRLLSLAGISGMTIAVLLGAAVLISKLVHGIEVPGYTATILTVIFFGGLNAFGLGLIGEYLWRTFENTKSRPAFIVAHRAQYDGTGSAQVSRAPGEGERP